MPFSRTSGIANGGIAPPFAIRGEGASATDDRFGSRPEELRPTLITIDPEARRKFLRVVSVGGIAGARHAGPVTTIVIHRLVGMLLANPTSVTTTLARH
jgi:hypothetical protein